MSFFRLIGGVLVIRIFGRTVHCWCVIVGSSVANRWFGLKLKFKNFTKSEKKKSFELSAHLPVPFWLDSTNRNNLNKREAVSNFVEAVKISLMNTDRRQQHHNFDNDAGKGKWKMVRIFRFSHCNFISLTLLTIIVNCVFLQCIHTLASLSGTHTAACFSTAFFPPKMRTIH